MRAHRFLYVARQVGAPAHQYKVGKTRQRPQVRLRSMGGQTEAKFELLAVFETLDEDTAERLAFEELDRRQLRKHRGTRKEIFVGGLELINRLCAQAARRSSESFRSRTASLVRAPEASSSGQVQLVGTRARLWRCVLDTPMALEGRPSTLGELLQRVHAQPSLHKRLEALGVRHRAYRRQGTEYELTWAEAVRVVQWLKAKGLQPPAQNSSCFTVRLSDA